MAVGYPLIGLFLGVLSVPYAVAAAANAAMSATDPVAVTILNIVMKGKMSHKAEQAGLIADVESLFNDAIALVAFVIAMGNAGLSHGGSEEAVLAVGEAIVIGLLAAVLMVMLKRAPIFRFAVIFLAIGWSANVHAAPLTMAVVCGFAVGLFLAESKFDTWASYVGLFGVALYALVVLFGLAGSLPVVAFWGGVYMIIFRILSRTLIIGLFIPQWRAVAFSGFPAVGVITIAAVTFAELGLASMAAFMAGAALTSVFVLAPLSVWALKNAD